MKRWAQKIEGFTIVELLIVVVVIAILATITIVSYNGITNQAAEAKRNTDTTTLLKAILAAREKTGKTLGAITGSYNSLNSCTSTSYNPSSLEPRELPKANNCWVRYYAILDNVGAAAGMNLDGLKSGDSKGNPYIFDENEGEGSNFCLTDGGIRYFTGNGITTSTTLSIPKAFSC